MPIYSSIYPWQMENVFHPQAIWGYFYCKINSIFYTVFMHSMNISRENLFSDSLIAPKYVKRLQFWLAKKFCSARYFITCSFLSKKIRAQSIPTQWHLLTPLGNKHFENTVGKGEIARLFPQCFLPIWISFSHFRQMWNCRLQTLSVWKSKICRLEMG